MYEITKTIDCLRYFYHKVNLKSVYHNDIKYLSFHGGKGGGHVFPHFKIILASLKEI